MVELKIEEIHPKTTAKDTPVEHGVKDLEWPVGI